MGYCGNGLGYAGGGPYEEGLGISKAHKRLRRAVQQGRPGAKKAYSDYLARRRARQAAGLTRKQLKKAGYAKDQYAAVQAAGQEAIMIRVRAEEARTGAEASARIAKAARIAAAASEAAASAAAQRERQAEDAEARREQRALDAVAERERRAADREAAQAIRVQEREEASALAAEERRLAVEQSEYERELYAATITGNGMTPATNGTALIDYEPPTYRPLPFTGGAGGAAPVYIDRAVNGAAPPAGGLDLGKILPIAAGAALLFLGR